MLGVNFPYVTMASLWYNISVWRARRGRNYPNQAEPRGACARGPGHIRLDFLSPNLIRKYLICPMNQTDQKPLSHAVGLSLFLSLLIFLEIGLQAPAQAQPRVEIPVTEHDFGQVREDMALAYSFVIKNVGDRDLKIVEVDPDCACTVADYKRVIPPGQEGKINLELKPFSVVHAFKKKTYVRFNDPNRTSVNLVLQGNAQKSIDIQPSHVIRFRGAPQQNLTAQVRFISHMPFPWEITKFQNSIPDKVDVTLKMEKPGKIYVMDITNKYHEQGRYVGKIVVFTNAIHKPKIIMRVIADLYPDSAVSP